MSKSSVTSDRLGSTCYWITTIAANNPDASLALPHTLLIWAVASINKMSETV